MVDDKELFGAGGAGDSGAVTKLRVSGDDIPIVVGSALKALEGGE